MICCGFIKARFVASFICIVPVLLLLSVGMLCVGPFNLFFPLNSHSACPYKPKFCKYIYLYIYRSSLNLATLSPKIYSPYAYISYCIVFVLCLLYILWKLASVCNVNMYIYKFVYLQSNTRLFFAHVRAASEPPVSEINCHPFVSGPFMFMHNGAVGNFRQVRSTTSNLSLVVVLLFHRC